MGQVVQVNGDYAVKTAEGGSILLNTGIGVGTVTVTGNLVVTGESFTVSASNLDVKDNIIKINDGETGAGVTLNYAGLQVDRGSLSAASLLYDEAADSWIIAQGTASTSFNYTNSNLRLRTISTNSATDDGDLTLIGAGNGVVKVIGTTNYEDNVTDNDDIPNKKYVDRTILRAPAFQIRSPISTPPVDGQGDTLVVVFDSASEPLDPFFFPIGPYTTDPVNSEIAFIVNDRRVALITESQFQMRGISIFPEDNRGNDIIGVPISQAVTIQATETNTNIKLETNGSGKVQVTYAMQFDEVAPEVIPSAVNNTTILYSGAPAGGGTGLYAVNTVNRDELVLYKRALLFSMIF